jgi:hypothetical protein
MGRANFDLIDSFFSIGIEVDSKDPSHYAVVLGQKGLGLPDRDYYLDSAAAIQQVRGKYKEYIERLLTLVGWPYPSSNAARIIELECRIATAPVCIHPWLTRNSVSTAAGLQPAFVEDVAEAVARALQGTERHAITYECGGPRVYSYVEFLRAVAHEAGLKPVLMTL